MIIFMLMPYNSEPGNHKIVKSINVRKFFWASRSFLCATPEIGLCCLIVRILFSFKLRYDELDIIPMRNVNLIYISNTGRLLIHRAKNESRTYVYNLISCWNSSFWSTIFID